MPLGASIGGAREPARLAPERARTYAVTVTKPGCQTWSLNGVVVSTGECGVNTVTLNARLKPAP